MYSDKISTTSNLVLNPDGSHSITTSGTIIISPDVNTWWNITPAIQDRLPNNAIAILFEKKRISSFQLLVSSRFDGNLVEVAASHISGKAPDANANAKVLVPNQWTEMITKIPDYKEIDEENTTTIYIRTLLNPAYKEYSAAAVADAKLGVVLGVRMTTDYIGDLGIVPKNLSFKNEDDKNEIRFGAYQVAVEKALNSVAEHKIINKMNDNLAKIESLNRNMPRKIRK